MTLEWTVDAIVDFPDDDINRLVNLMLTEGYDEKKLYHEIMEVVYCFEDNEYYLWGTEQTKAVADEIKRRCGGVQLNMFTDFGLE